MNHMASVNRLYRGGDQMRFASQSTVELIRYQETPSQLGTLAPKVPS